jgi:outer membrane lipoprotein-sorting protein
MFKKFSLALILCLMGAVLVSCTQGSYRISNGSVDFSRESASGAYAKFDGYKERIVSLEEGETLTLNFSAETQSGRIHAIVLDSDKQELFVLNESGTMSYDVGEEGRYRIRVSADDHKGAFALSWNILK